MNVTQYVLICGCAILVASKRIEFPKELDRCQRDDPRVDECLRKAIQKGIPVIAKGIPRVGLIPVEPLITSRCTVEQTIGLVRLNFTVENVFSRGYSNMTITRVRSRLSQYQLDIDAKMPRIIVEGDYTVSANIFQLPIEGTGSFVITLDNISATLRIRGKSQLRSGLEYLQVTRTPITFQPEKLKMYFRNLFGGNEQLGKQANRFLNRNSMAVFYATKPVFEDAISKIIEAATYPFFSKVAYNNIFL